MSCEHIMLVLLTLYFILLFLPTVFVAGFLPPSRKFFLYQFLGYHPYSAYLHLYSPTVFRLGFFNSLNLTGWEEFIE